MPDTGTALTALWMTIVGGIVSGIVVSLVSWLAKRWCSSSARVERIAEHLAIVGLAVTGAFLLIAFGVASRPEAPADSPRATSAEASEPPPPPKATRNQSPPAIASETEAVGKDTTQPRAGVEPTDSDGRSTEAPKPPVVIRRYGILPVESPEPASETPGRGLANKEMSTRHFAPICSGLITLSSGRSLSVRAAFRRGPEAIVQLRGGGEASLDAEGISRTESTDWVYDRVVAQLGKQSGVDPRLIYALIVVGSNCNPSYRSPAGAVGLMQVPTSEGRYSHIDLNEPETNLRVGVNHLKYLLDRFETPLAIAAYHTSESAVRSAQDIPPDASTRAFVQHVMEAASLIP